MDFNFHCKLGCNFGQCIRIKFWTKNDIHMNLTHPIFENDIFQNSKVFWNSESYHLVVVYFRNITWFSYFLGYHSKGYPTCLHMILPGTLDFGCFMLEGQVLLTLNDLVGNFVSLGLSNLVPGSEKYSKFLVCYVFSLSFWSRPLVVVATIYPPFFF